MNKGSSGHGPLEEPSSLSFSNVLRSAVARVGFCYDSF